MDLIDQMARLYAKKDAEQLLTIFDADFCGYGSGPDEVIRGKDQFRAQIKRDFTRCEALTIEFANLKVNAGGTIARFIGDV